MILLLEKGVIEDVNLNNLHSIRQLAVRVEPQTRSMLISQSKVFSLHHFKLRGAEVRADGIHTEKAMECKV